MKIGNIHIWVNGVEHSVMSTDQYAELSYEELVELAGKQPSVVYTVVYDNRRMLGGGSLVSGESCTLYDGAVVNVGFTGYA